MNVREEKNVSICSRTDDCCVFFLLFRDKRKKNLSWEISTRNN